MIIVLFTDDNTNMIFKPSKNMENSMKIFLYGQKEIHLPQLGEDQSPIDQFRAICHEARGRPIKYFRIVPRVQLSDMRAISVVK